MEILLIIVLVVVVVLGFLWTDRLDKKADESLKNMNIDVGGMPMLVVVAPATILLSGLTWYLFGIEYSIGVAVAVILAPQVFIFIYFYLILEIFFGAIDSLIENPFKTIFFFIALCFAAYFMGVNFAFKILLAGTFLLVAHRMFMHCDGKKCPQCNTCVKYPFNRELISSKYRYVTKSGERDKRYKNNRLQNNFRYSYKCAKQNCGHEFTVDSTNQFIEVRKS